MHSADSYQLPAAPAWVNLATTLVRLLPRGRYRAMNSLCPRAAPAFWARMPDRLGGGQFVCDLRDTISKEVCFTGVYEPQETALVSHILQPGMNFVDVGANWGYFTLMAARLVGAGGRVLSLEPDPRMFRKLTGNLTRNQLPQVTALQIAAAATAGNLTLAGYDENDGNFGISRLVADGTASANLFQVETQPLDDLLDAQKMDSVDLMKMDIEGAEALALAGLKRSLAEGRVKRLLMELHPSQLLESGSSANQVMQMLLQSGYTALTVDHSPATTRAMAYRRISDSKHILRPFNPDNALDAWPHQLWLSPGSEVL